MKNALRTLGFLTFAVSMSGLMPAVASASTVDITGLTFSAEADSDFPKCCSVSAGGATVGNYYFTDYQSHGLSEFDLGSLSGHVLPNAVATISFDLSAFSILFNQDSSPIGTILAGTYRGDNQISLLDYYAPGYRRLTDFSLDNAVIGQRFSVDVTDAFGIALADQVPALGVLLRYQGANDTFATFDHFVLNVSADADLQAIGAVPEPATWGLMLAGLVAVGALGKRRAGRPIRPVSVAPAA